MKIPCLPICALVLLSSTLIGFAVQPPGTPSLPNLDQRREENAPKAQRGEATLDAVRGAAYTNLQSRIAGVSIALDDATGSPKFIFNRDGFLSPPDSLKELEPKTVEELQKAKAQPEAPRDPHGAIKRFVEEYKVLFGHDTRVLAQARNTRDYVTEHNGMRTVVWEQELDGIPVFEAVFYGHITKNGELVSLSSQFMPELEKASGLDAKGRAEMKGALPVPAWDAVTLAAANIGEPAEVETLLALDVETGVGAQQRQRFTAPSLRHEADARLVWLPMNRNSLRLCWQVVLTGQTRNEQYKVLVDGLTGEPLVRHLETFHAQPATFNVFTSDSPSPFSPGHPTPSQTQPAVVSQSSVQMLNVYSSVASPDGWIPDGGNTTVGNNVDAHTDWKDLHQFYGEPATPQNEILRPIGSPYRVFNFTPNLNQEPTYSDASYDNPNASVVQLFYWCNWMHDRLHELGFTEAAGNFQQNNYGRGGLGGDAILADAQDGATRVWSIPPPPPILTADDNPWRNNANFSTGPDGTSGRIQMYLFSGPTPDRDGGLDAEIVLHEYAHGLSMRLVGHGTGISGSEASAMGEGWSDFYALSLLSEAGDLAGGNYAVGARTTYNYRPLTFGFNFLDNYYFGIRRYPYSTDMSKNPLRFKDLFTTPWEVLLSAGGPPYATPYPNVPITPTYVNNAKPPPIGPHALGEVWCVVLWEARAGLIAKHGFATGNQLILQLVTDGMKLCPPNPDYIEARDAILLADRVKSGGANLNELWTAFAKRGWGYTAWYYQANYLSEAFDVPPQAQAKWAFTAGNAVYSSPAIGVDGTIYVGSDDGNVYALDPDTGAQIWAYTESMPSPQSFRSAPLVGPDGTIYIRRTSGHLYAINPNGTLKWKVYIDYDSYVSPAIGRDGNIYIAGYTSLKAISPQGVVLWSYATGNTIYSSPAVAPDGTIYFGGMDAKLHAVLPGNGVSKGGLWPVTLGGYVASSPAIGSDGTIYVGCDDKKLYAIRQDGTLKWPALNLNGWVQASPAIGPDGSIYVSSWTQNICCSTPVPSYVYSINPTTGQPNSGWPVVFSSSPILRSSPAVAADGTVYVGGYDAKLYAFNPNGTTKSGGWPFNTYGAVFSSPAIGRDGTVYVGTAGSKVHAIKGVSGLARSSWPMFRRDPRHFAHSASVSLHSGARWPGNAFQFTITAGPELSSVLLEASSDLNTWTSLGNVILPGGTTNYIDGFATTAQRSYRVSGANGYRSFNPYGYVTKTLAANAWTMLSVPLLDTNSTVRALFNGATVNMSVKKLNQATGVEDEAVFQNGAWSGPNFSIRPGEAVKFNNPNGFYLVGTFVGEVLQGNLVNPIPNGFSWRSSMMPKTGTLTTFLGYPAGPGDTYHQALSSGAFQQSAYYYPSQWTPSQPVVNSPTDGFGINNASSAKNWIQWFSVWPSGP